MFKLFREISKHRTLLEKQPSLYQLFCAAFEITDTLTQVSTLQKEFIITELGFSYQHFGFSLFAIPSLELAKCGLAKLCGVDPQFVEKYMLNLKEFLHNEINFEKKESYFSEESLKISFIREFLKRIFCTEKEEDVYTGMLIFDDFFVDKVRKNSRTKISKFNSKIIMPQDDNYEMAFDIGEGFYQEFIALSQHLKADPLNLIVGRLESFINSLNSDLNPIFIFREQDDFIDEKSKKITAILSLLVPHRESSGHMLLKDNMLTVKQIAKLFSPKFKSEFFNLQPIKTWLGVGQDYNLNTQFEFLMEEAIKCGVVFKVPRGNKDFSYGLSDSGLKIIKPFHSILTDSLLAV